MTLRLRAFACKIWLRTPLRIAPACIAALEGIGFLNGSKGLVFVYCLQPFIDQSCHL